jgi:hypothetical protein
MTPAPAKTLNCTLRRGPSRCSSRSMNGTVPLTERLLQNGSRQDGFTLMEIALALLAIGLAFLTLLGLGRSGLDSVKEANSDTRCEAMASAVFDTLETYNHIFADYARTNRTGATWAQMWSTSPIPFPPVAGMATNTIPLLINREDISRAFDPESISLNNWNPRYRLWVRPGRTSESVASSHNMLNVILFIYPDGDTYSSRPRIYSTLINRPGEL